MTETSWLDDFVSEVREAVLASGSAHEGVLTGPTRALLTRASQLCGVDGLTVVGQVTGVSGAGGGVPDFSVYDRKARLILCLELKEPGKGADPTSFSIQADKQQWSRFKGLPNLIYSDGNEWSLWHKGQMHGKLIEVCADVAGSAPLKVDAAERLLNLLSEALTWRIQPIRNPSKLADVAPIGVGFCVTRWSYCQKRCA